MAGLGMESNLKTEDIESDQMAKAKKKPAGAKKGRAKLPNPFTKKKTKRK
jgi:hypothetical protein